jgi:hypothetical protein
MKPQTPQAKSELREAGESRCHQCEYVLGGLTSGRCPECGTLIDPPGRSARRARRLARLRANLPIVAGLIVVHLAVRLVLPASPVFDNFRRYGLPGPFSLLGMGPTGQALGAALLAVCVACIIVYLAMCRRRNILVLLVGLGCWYLGAWIALKAGGSC